MPEVVACCSQAAGCRQDSMLFSGVVSKIMLVDTASNHKGQSFSGLKLQQA